MIASLHLTNTRILMRQIDWQDNSFCLSPGKGRPMPETLLDSIARTAILHPPILRKKETDLYQIVSGWKRLQVAKDALNKTALDCLILPYDISEKEALAVALEDAMLSGPLSPAQQAMFCKKALKWQDEKTIAERFLPLLDLAPQPYNVNKFLPLLDLEEQLVDAVHLGFLDATVALEFAKLSFVDRMSLYEVIEYLGLSVSNQKKITVVCRELATRDNTGIMSILGSPAAKEILDHPTANPPQKAANFMKWLTRKQLPRLSKAEADFTQFIGKLGLPKGTTLSHAPSFETDALTLTINFRNKEDLLKVWPDMQNTLSQKDQN